MKGQLLKVSEFNRPTFPNKLSTAICIIRAHEGKVHVCIYM